jgi:N-carbamoylputrescine amidase
LGAEKDPTLKVTVCELHDDAIGFASDWDCLVAHVKATAADLVLLPEMPFCPWFGAARQFEPAVWQAAVEAHDAAEARLAELASPVVLSSRPVNDGDLRVNEGFVWEPARGYRAVHRKYYLPDEPGNWEATWYNRGQRQFAPVDSDGVRIGFLICTELWYSEWARAYGHAGVHLVASPRASGRAIDKWLAGGRVSAVVSGAFSLSSNHVSAAGQPTNFGGQGWVIGPDGDVLALTSPQQPFVTVEIDLAEAERAKRTYPRDVPE